MVMNVAERENVWFEIELSKRAWRNALVVDNETVFAANKVIGSRRRLSNVLFEFTVQFNIISKSIGEPPPSQRRGGA